MTAATTNVPPDGTRDNHGTNPGRDAGHRVGRPPYPTRPDPTRPVIYQEMVLQAQDPDAKAPGANSTSKHQTVPREFDALHEKETQ